MVDGAEQIIVAAEVTNAANDKQQAVPMAQAALDNLNAAGIERPKGADGTPTPIPNTADTGYFSEEAVEELGEDGHGSAHRHRSPEAPRSGGSARGGRRRPRPRRVRRKRCSTNSRSATGKALYAARKHIVEPVFGQIKSARGIRRFLLRGLEKVSAEWQLICLTHNLLKIWRRVSGVGVSSGG